MTLKEKIQILNDAVQRAYEEVERTDGSSMGTENFQRLLNAIDRMQFIRDVQLKEGYVIPDPVKDFAPEPEIPAEPDPSDEPEPEKPETGDDEEPAFKMEEVRAALAKARGRGVNVSEIIRSFGVNSFPEIPKNKYGAIMAKLAEV